MKFEDFGEFTRQNIKLAYGLPPDWDIDAVTFSETVCAVLASLPDFTPEYCCSGRKERRGAASRFFRGAPVGGRHVQILLTYPQYRCQTCNKILSPDLPEDAILPPLKNLIANFVLSGSISGASRHFALDRRDIAGIAETAYAPRMEARKVPPPVYLGIDGTRVLGQDCVMLVDLQRGKHVEILEGNTFMGLYNFLREQRPAWEDTLQCVVIDPHKPLKKAVTDAWPGMKIVLDRYHVSQLINKKITRWATQYKNLYDLKGDMRSLRHPDRAAYKTLANRMISEGHGILVTAHEYARRVRQVYEAPNSSEAREVWLDWVDALPADLEPVLGSTIRDLNTYWRAEICNAADYHMPSKARGDHDVVLSNGMTEALHKRLRNVVGSASRMAFDSIRTRLLLTDSSDEKDAVFREDRLAIKDAKKMLQREAKERAGRTNTTLVLPRLENAHDLDLQSPEPWQLPYADAED